MQDMSENSGITQVELTTCAPDSLVESRCLQELFVDGAEPYLFKNERKYKFFHTTNISGSRNFVPVKASRDPTTRTSTILYGLIK